MEIRNFILKSQMGKILSVRRDQLIMLQIRSNQLLHFKILKTMGELTEVSGDKRKTKNLFCVL